MIRATSPLFLVRVPPESPACGGGRHMCIHTQNVDAHTQIVDTHTQIVDVHTQYTDTQIHSTLTNIHTQSSCCWGLYLRFVRGCTVFNGFGILPGPGLPPRCVKSSSPSSSWLVWVSSWPSVHPFVSFHFPSGVIIPLSPCCGQLLKPPLYAIAVKLLPGRVYMIQWMTG